MTKGFKKDGKFRPTGDNKKLSASELGLPKKGIEPLEPFSRMEKIRLLTEQDLARDFSFQDLDEALIDTDAKLSSIFFAKSGKKFFSTEVAFKHEGKLDPEFDLLLQERRKIIGASNKKTMKSLGGAEIFDPEPTGFPEIDEMMR